MWTLEETQPGKFDNRSQAEALEAPRNKLFQLEGNWYKSGETLEAFSEQEGTSTPIKPYFQQVCLLHVTMTV